MLIGYMRVSSENESQNTDLQYDALINVGFQEIFMLPRTSLLNKALSRYKV